MRLWTHHPKDLDARDRARRLTVTRGQVAHEWRHLLAKLRVRDPARRRALAHSARPAVHPRFRVVAGGVASWERT